MATGAEPPDFRGKIVYVHIVDDRVLMIHVEASPDDVSKYISAYVGIKDFTQVYRTQAGKIEQVAPAQLREGMLVDVLFTGTVLESSPIQVTASEVLILSEEE